MKKDNLLNFSCRVQKESHELTRQKDRNEQERNIFTSEKSFTYPKIYDLFFIKRKITSWEEVPPLFLIKFPIYLFLDGRDTKGEKVYERILDKENDFEIYTMLMHALTDDNFEMPDDTKHIELVTKFMETLPPIPIVTPSQIMNKLNEQDNDGEYTMFKEDDTEENNDNDDNE